MKLFPTVWLIAFTIFFTIYFMVKSQTPAPAPPVNNNNAHCTKYNRDTTLICEMGNEKILAAIVGGKK